MSAPIRFWRHHLRPKGTWAVVFLDDRGVFSAVSDYGNYGCAWTAHGCRDAREFFVMLGERREFDYAARKLAPGRDDYDGAHTERCIRDAILERRRRLDFTREQAASEWELLHRCFDVATPADFQRWCDCTYLDDASEFASYVTNRRATQFAEIFLPPLAKVLRAELEAEGYFAPAAQAVTP